MAVDWIVYKTRLYQRVTSCLCTPLSVLHSLQKQDKRNKDCISDTLLFNRRIYFTERESRFDPRGISSPFPSHKYYSSNANNLKKIVEFSGKNSDSENCAKKKYDGVYGNFQTWKLISIPRNFCLQFKFDGRDVEKLGRTSNFRTLIKIQNFSSQTCN